MDNVKNVSGAGQTDGLADSRTGAQAAQDQSGSHGAGRDAGRASVVNRAHDNDPVKGDTVFAGATGTESQSRPAGDSGLASGSSTDYSQPGTSSTAGDATSGLTGSSATKTAGVESTSADTTSHSRSVGDSGLTSGSSTGDATSGLTGSSATKAAGVDPIIASTSSTVGRDVGIAGGLVAGAGAGAVSGASRNNNENAASNTTSTQPIGERSHPVTSGTTHDYINPVGAPEASLGQSAGQSGPHSHSGSSHTGILGSSQHTTGVPSGGVHNNEGITQLNRAPSDVQAATFLDRSFYIGKPGDPVSHGPHVPGEFPADAVSASTASQPLSTTAQGTASSDHTSRNAALAGGAVGAGALGAGAYASSRNQPSSTVGQSAGSVESARDPAFAHYGRESSAPTTSTTSGLSSSTTTGHTHGRDAAVAGGAGALGAGGAYAATRDQAYPVNASGLTSSSQQPVTSSQSISALHSSTVERPRSDVAVTGVPATTQNLNTDTTAATHDLDEKTTHAAYGNEDPNKHNKLHKPTPEEKKLEKEHAKEEKHLEKQHHAAEKQHEKDDKERRHAAEKAEKKHEKEAEKEKKPSLIDRILHRHKDDKDETTSGGEPLHVKENTANGPLDHPLITAAGTTTTAGNPTGTSVAPAAYQSGGSPADTTTTTTTATTNPAGTSVTPAAYQSRGSAASLNIDENKEKSSLRQSSVTSGLQTTTTRDSVGSPVTPAAYQSGGATAGPDWEAIKKSNTPQ